MMPWTRFSASIRLARRRVVCFPPPLCVNLCPGFDISDGELSVEFGSTLWSILGPLRQARQHELLEVLWYDGWTFL